MYKLLRSKIIFKHKRLTLIEDRVALPNKEETDYLKFEYPGEAAVTVIAKRRDGKILLHKEYFYPAGKKLFTFPGGMVEKGEGIKRGARRELLEEAQLRPRKLKALGNYYFNDRRSDMKLFAFLASDLEEDGSGRNEPEEEGTERFWLSEKQIETLIKTRLFNNHSLAAWLLYKIKETR